MLNEHLEKLAASIRDSALTLASIHEQAAHGGAICWKERIGLIAYLCHCLAVRGPALLDVIHDLAEYDAHCENTQCSHDLTPQRPRIVCIFGPGDSDIFDQAFAEAIDDETRAGKIVLNADWYFAGNEEEEYDARAQEALLRAKIDIAHEVFVVNPGGMVDSRTRRSIVYAQSHAKHVRYLELPR